MMTQAFYTGISGIKSNSEGINIVSDNLANINTVGFKANDYEFASLFEDMISTNAQGSSVNSSVGLGVDVQANSMVNKEGSPMLSEKSTDLAIQGDGWFGIQGANEPIYTRNGNFSFDKNSDLVTGDGYHVLGTKGNNVSGDKLTSVLDNIALSDVKSQEKLNFPQSLKYPAEATKNVKFSGNIGTDNTVREMGAEVIDANGDKNSLKLNFTKSATQTLPGSQWDVKATVESLDGKTIYDTKNAKLGFDDKGALVSSDLSTMDNNGSIVNVDFGNSFSGIVSFANTPISASSSSDGTVGGDLISYDINKNGEVIASFTNGKQSSVGKIGVFHFQNNQGLDRISGTRFKESPNSGNAIFYKDANGNNIIGTDISNYKLESSNVSTEAGLTNLIILQRAYDANSKSITTADQMIQKALSMHK